MMDNSKDVSNGVDDFNTKKTVGDVEVKEITPLREALPQISATAVKNVLLLAWGLTLGFPTILIPSLSGDDPDEELTLGVEAISWIGSINLVFVPLGSIISGSITQGLGRRRGMQLSNIPFIISWLLLHFSNKIWHVFLALSLCGLSGGLLEAPVLTYVAEITQPHLRGILSATSSASVVIGSLLQFLLGTFLSWRTVAFINCSIPIASVVLLMFVPETPVWLISKNRLDEARRSIAWLRGWVKVEDVEDEFQELYKQIHNQSNNEKYMTFMDKLNMFKHKNFLWPYFLVSMAFFLSHFNGTTTLNIYAIKIFAVLKAPINKYHATVVMGCVQLLGSILCMVLINILGKRLISFVSLLGTAMCFFIVGTHAYMFKIYHFEGPTGNFSNVLNATTNSTVPGLNVESYHWIPMCFLVLAAFLTYLGIRILPWVLTGEVYATEIRAAASGLSGGTGYILNFISSKIFLTLVYFLTLPGVFWLYGIMGILGTVAIYYMLPETEGKSLFEVTEHFAGRSKLRNSVGRKKRFGNGNCNPAFVNDERGLNDTKL